MSDSIPYTKITHPRSGTGLTQSNSQSILGAMSFAMSGQEGPQVTSSAWCEKEVFWKNEPKRLLPADLEVGMVCRLAVLIKEVDRPTLPGILSSVTFINLKPRRKGSDITLSILDVSGNLQPFQTSFVDNDGYTDNKQPNLYRFGTYRIDSGYFFGPTQTAGSGVAEIEEFLAVNALATAGMSVDGPTHLAGVLADGLRSTSQYHCNE